MMWLYMRDCSLTFCILFDEQKDSKGQDIHLAETVCGISRLSRFVLVLLSKHCDTVWLLPSASPGIIEFLCGN